MPKEKFIEGMLFTLFQRKNECSKKVLSLATRKIRLIPYKKFLLTWKAILLWIDSFVEMYDFEKQR
jgi:hypothetical protein